MRGHGVHGNRGVVAGTLFLLMLFAGTAAAEQVIFVVRHAERADGGAGAAMTNAPADPPLSGAGHERA